MQETPIQNAIRELHKAFYCLNDALFNSALPLAAITCQHQGNRTKNVFGWCTTKEIWKNNEKTIKQYEINITAEYLNRPYEDIMETMIHEMVHLYCSVNGIKDTSRNNSYHNKRYKAEAERFGLEVEFNKSLGWAMTSLRSETKDLIAQLPIDPEAFLIKRYSWGDDEEDEDDAVEDDPKSKGKIKRYWCCPSEDCENRETKIKAKKDKPLDLICGKCREHFVYVEEKEEISEEDISQES